MGSGSVQGLWVRSGSMLGNLVVGDVLGVIVSRFRGVSWGSRFWGLRFGGLGSGGLCLGTNEFLCKPTLT